MHYHDSLDLLFAPKFELNGESMIDEVSGSKLRVFSPKLKGGQAYYLDQVLESNSIIYPLVLCEEGEALSHDNICCSHSVL